MHVLITNDDGIHAEGIQVLCKYLLRLGSVCVVAPERERSATGHGITMHKPLRVTEVKMKYVDISGYAVSGTPADCVKLALEALMPETPDVIVSGINLGANLGTDILYSGTVSAAIEGTIAGVKSMAVSLDTESAYPDFTHAAEFTAGLAKVYSEKDFPPDTLINVNIPDLPWEQIKGVKISKLGYRRYIDSIEERKDPRGRSYFWLAGEIADDDSDPDTDSNTVKQEMISVCPVHFDLTKYDIIEQIRSWDITK